MTKKVKTSKKDSHAVAKPQSFEKALDRLEAIVSQLEGAEASLEKALALYEEGVGLSRFCSQQLKTAERKVELLEDKNNELRGRPFAHESSNMAGNKGFEEEDVDYEEDKEESEDDDEEDEESDEDEEDDEQEDNEEETVASEEIGKTGFPEDETDQKENEAQENLF
jgi:exodeoxyribonuclease VII small subunit